MKIYGKTLQQIFSEMETPQKAVVVAGSVFIVFALGYLVFFLATYGERNTYDMPGPIRLQTGSTSHGMAEPSLAHKGGMTMMAYTNIIYNSPQPGDFYTNIRLARDTRNCLSWTGLPQPLFTGQAEEIVGPDGVTPVAGGRWRIETPSIVYDPGDTGREWKVFAYKYFWTGDIPLARLYNAIVYKYASDPIQGPWSEEEWLFSANENAPPYPYGSLVQKHLNTLHPDLRDVYFYSRPSVVQRDGRLLMSLSVFVQGKNTVDRIILLESSDHARSWQYLGVLLDSNAMQGYAGTSQVQGGTLLQQGERLFLAAVMGTEKVQAGITFIFEVEDAATAKLFYDAKEGAPKLVAGLGSVSHMPTEVGGGFAGYADSCRNGMLVSEYSGVHNRFVIFQTYRKPDPKAQ